VKNIFLFIWNKTKDKVNFFIVGRIFEGISVGMYANNINIFVDNEISFDLTYKMLIAIIFTVTAIVFQRSM